MTRQQHIRQSILLGTLVALLLAIGERVRAADSIPRSEDILRRYIPASRLDAVMSKDAPGALLPIADFESLLKEAHARSGEEGVKPTGASLVRADYALRIQDERLLATCRVTLRSFDAAWQAIPLPIRGLSVLTARFEGDARAPKLSRNPQQHDQLTLLLSELGTKTLVLELSAPLTAAGGDRAAGFQFVNAPLGEMTVTLPAGKRLRVDGLLIDRPAPDDKPAEYRVAIGGRPQTRLIITDRKTIDRSDSMTFASTVFGVSASPGEATWTARTQLNVFGRPLDKLECEVPSSLEITDVESQGLEAWQLSDAAPGKTRITLTWRQPFDGGRPMTFRGVFSAGRDGRWHVPNLILHSVSSHTGVLILDRPSGVRLQVIHSAGVRPVETDDKKAAESGHTTSQFEIWKEDFALEFVPAAKEREVQAAMSTLVSLGAQGADLMMTADLETRFAPLFEADILLPAAWQVLEATHKGERANWQLAPEQAGRNRIRIQLQPPLKPGESRTISLTAHFEPEGWPVAATPIRLVLPEVRVPQAGVVEALYGVTADADLDVVPIEITGLTPARQSDVNSLNQQLAAFNRTVRLGFTYQDTVFTGQLEVRRLPARLTATCVTLTRIDAEEIASHVEAQLAIGGGGVRELTVKLPETVGRDLRFSIGHLRPRPLFGVTNEPALSALQAATPLKPLPVILEQKPGTAANGQIPWTIKLDRYATGEFVLQADVSQPRAIAATGQVQQWTAPGITIVGADRESGAIGIEAADDQYVQAEARDAAGQPMQPVDPIDFPPAHVRPKERLVAAYAYDRPGWTVTVSETRLNRIPMPTAVIHRLALASIVGVDGVKEIQADATLSAVGVQSIVIRLPQDHTLWGALVDGSPVQVHKSGAALSLPLSPVDPPSRPRDVRLIYAPAEGQAGVKKHLGGFELEETPPTFLVMTGEGTEQPLTVLSSEWTVHHSADLDLVHAGGVFHPSIPLERDSLLDRMMSLFRVPQSEDAIWKIAVLGAVVVVLWLFAVAPRRAPNMFVGCLLAVIAILVVAVVIPVLQPAREAASRYGLKTTAAPTPPVMAPEGAPSNFGDDFSKFRADAPGAGPKSGAELFDADQDRAALFGTNRKRDEPQFEPTEETLKESIELKMHAGEQRDTAGLIIRRGLEKQKTEPLPANAPPAPSAEPATPLAAAKPQMTERFGRSKRADGTRGLVRGEGLLSVAFGLEPPKGSTSNVLQSTSDEVNSPHPPLSLRFMETSARNLWTCLAALVTALIGWWLRKAGVVARLLFMLITLLGPISMRWLLPLSWLPMADGVWLGGLATVVLWMMRGLVISICDCPCVSRWCKPGPKAAAALILMTVLGLASTSMADEAAPARPATQPAPDTVFVPYDNPREPLSAKNVFVPQELFLKLWRSAYPEDTPPIKPPTPALVSAAAFVVDLTKLPDSVSEDGRPTSVLAPVRGRLVLINLTAAPTPLALPIHGIAIRSATLEGSPAILDSQDGASLIVTLPKPGVAILDLDFDVTVQRTGPAGKLHWENGAVPAGVLSLKLPKTDPRTELRVSGSPVSAKADGTDDVFEIPVDRGGPLDISWQPASSRSGDQSPVQVQATTAVTLDDAGLTARTKYTAKVGQSGVTELSFAFPGPMRLKRVEGPDVGGWRIDGDNAARKLVVFFSRKIESTTSFSIETFQALAIDERQQAVAVVPPQPEGVSRETGKIGVFVARQLAARPGNLTGLTQEDSSQLVPLDVMPTHPLQLVYRYAARPVSLELIVQRRQAETRADVGHGVYLTQRKLRLSTRAVFHVAGAPRSTLSLQLPAGYLLLDATSPALADYSLANGDGGRKVLTIELDRPRVGDIEVLLNGSLTRRPEEPSAVIATPRVLDVAKVDSQLGVWVEDLYVATTDALGDWKNADPGSLDAALRGLRPTAMQFGFQSAAVDPQPVTIGLRTQSAELSADVLSLIAVSDSAIDYGFTMQWRITRAATDTFSFTTPGWLRNKIDFAGVGVRQVTSADLPGDRVRWTVSLTDPVRDAYLLTGAASLASPADGRVIAPDISFESSVAGGAASRLETQRQYAVVVNLSRRPLALEDPKAVEVIRRDALPLKVPDQLVRQAMNIVQIIPGRTASWLAKRVQTTGSLQATVTGSRLETVVEVDGSWRTQATYTLRNRGRQYLPVDLSAMGDVRILSILVKGNPARALESNVGGKSLRLVPLPPSSAADLSFDVVVMLAGKLGQPLPKDTSIASTTLELPAPHITTPAESAQFGIPVAQTAWVVRLPDGVQAEIDDSGNLTPHQAAEWELLSGAQTLTQLETDAAEMLRIVSDGESSEQRKNLAWFNLKYLSKELADNRRQIDVMAQQAAESTLEDKLADFSRSNLGRNDALKAKVDLELQRNEAAKGLATQQNQAPMQTPALPQLQGSLNFELNANSVATNGLLPAQQAGQGRAYILDNSRSILNSNAFNSGEMESKDALEFSFRQPMKQEDRAAGLKSHTLRDVEDLGNAPTRSGLKRRLAEQRQAGTNLDFQSNLDAKIQALNSASPGVGGLGGATGAPAGGGGFGAFGGGSLAGAAAPAGRIAGPVNEADSIEAVAGWSSGAGLSLVMNLPAPGDRSLAFSKVGGDPKLVLKARSREARRAAWGIGELVVAVLIAVWLLTATTSSARFRYVLGIVVALAAAAAFVLLPGGERWLALALFIVSGFYLAWPGRRPLTPAASV